jgi:dTDP-4-dehydrorhamnose 3,5-epimerase
MHLQVAPHEEAKLVRCVRGAIYDVVVDLRPSSPTFRLWRSFELTERNRNALFIPAGIAHGFQTLEDDSEVLYQMSAFYEPSASRGVRWNDPAFGIRWPIAHAIISDRDRSFPDFASAAAA